MGQEKVRVTGLGFFLGMTASSLSVSILMARSSSVTRAHGLLPACSAENGPTLPIAMTNTTNGKKKVLQALKEVLDSQFDLCAACQKRYAKNPLVGYLREAAERK